MAEVLDEYLETKWLDGLEEELSKDLVDSHESMMNKLISTVYSGPTISDIESALASSYQGNKKEGHSRTQPVISIPAEKGKIDNKYTLKIKSCGNGGITDDGYKWRKYGQKSIKNSPNPRSYYRCTNPRCNAKKQVERSIEDPETLVVTYEGLHLHYTYSHFLLPRPQNSLSNPSLHVPKKPKLQDNPNSENPASEDQNPNSEDQNNEEEKTQSQTTKETEDNPQEEPLDHITTDPGIGKECMQHDILIEEEQSTRGLLEDIVPLLVRKPFSSTMSSNEPSSSIVSSPSYSSSLSWSPTDFYFDVGILSSIL